MTRAPLYAITFTPSARRLLGKLPLSVASALFEHLTGPVADNPYRLSKPLDAPFDDVRAARRGDYRVLYVIDDRSRTRHGAGRCPPSRRLQATVISYALPSTRALVPEGNGVRMVG